MFNAHSGPGRALAAAIFCGTLAQAAVPAATARADGLCADINVLVGLARSNFADTAGTAGAAVPPVLPGADACTLTAVLSGGHLYHCTWEFAYRESAAPAAFEAFNRSFEDCLGDRARITEDRPVNHPDTYDARQYRVDDVTVTVSIKDKGALQRTYVFVSVQGGSPD